MKIDRKSLIEILSAGAVVASLVFVGMQLMLDRQFAESQTAREITLGFRELGRSIAQSTETADIWARGIAEFESLSPTEIIVFGFISSDFVLGFRDAQLAYQANLIGPDVYIGIGRSMGGIFGTPGGSVWWALNQPNYGAELRDAINGFVENEDYVMFDELAP